jgi:hypothetical protein
MPIHGDDEFRAGELLHADDFADVKNWSAEFERPGRFEAVDGKLVIDVPAGLTAWFRPKLSGPVVIEYDAKVISAGGPNDRVSDLNCFWMATDPKHPEDLLAHPRSGKFADYNDLLTYYVGLGGNANMTTRFRRYVGDKENRPLLPEHDLKDEASLLKANVLQHIKIVAAGERIRFYRDGKLLFDVYDANPYRVGWFGVRTVTNHMEISAFRVRKVVGRTTAGEDNGR